MRIVFHIQALCERGATLALFDYADQAEKLLGHASFVAYQSGRAETHPDVERRFQKRFPCFTYLHFSEVEPYLKDIKADAFYAIKPGGADKFVVRCCPNLFHATLTVEPPSESGADSGADSAGKPFIIYAAVSETMAASHSHRHPGARGVPYVPHMFAGPVAPRVAGLELRAQLGIPADALVIGRHGGFDSFDIAYVREAVLSHLQWEDKMTRECNPKAGKGTYFLFLNTEEKKLRHPRIFHLRGTGEREKVAQFVAACDAMLHARRDGETFGLAVGEFAMVGKPVMTSASLRQNHHIKALEGKALVFYDSAGVLEYFRELPRLIPSRDWHAYSAFTPEAVMQKFKEVFLDPLPSLPLSEDEK
jgi:hypothetical protein